MTKELILSWLLTYWLHSLIALSGMWLASRWLRERNLALEETGWKAAMFLTLVTASLQLGLTQGAGYRPIAGTFELVAVRAASAGEEASPQATTDLENGRVTARVGAIPVGETTKLEPNGVIPIPAGDGISAAAAGGISRLGGGATLVLALWIALIATQAARLAGSYLLLMKQLEMRRVLLDGPVVSQLKRLCGRAGIVRDVRLSLCSRLSIPLALGLRRWEVCLPARLTEEFGADEQATVLAHELAHLVRRDAIWLLAARALAGALFFQPFNFLALERLKVLSELRSDDWAVAQTGRPITLARCLTRVAAWRTSAWTNLPLPAMAGASGSQFGDRVRRLLSRGYPKPITAVPAWFKASLVLIGLAFVAAAPGSVARARDAEVPDDPAAAPQEQPADLVAPPAVRNETTAPRPVRRPRRAPRGLAARAPQSPPAPPATIAAPTSSRRPTTVSLRPGRESTSSTAAPPSTPLANARYAHRREDGSFLGSDESPGPSPAPSNAQSYFGADVDSDSDSNSDSDSESDSDSADEDSYRELGALEEALEDQIEAFEEAYEAEIEPIQEALEEHLDQLEDHLEGALDDLYDEFEDGLELDLEDALEEVESRVEETQSSVARRALERVLAKQEIELDRFEQTQIRALAQLEEVFERKLDGAWGRDMERELERAFETSERVTEQRMEDAARELERALRALESKAVGDEELLRLRTEALDRARTKLPTAAELAEMRGELERLSLEFEPGLGAVEEMRAGFEQALEQWRQGYRADLDRHLDEFRVRVDSTMPGDAEPEP